MPANIIANFQHLFKILTYCGLRFIHRCMLLPIVGTGADTDINLTCPLTNLHDIVVIHFSVSRYECRGFSVTPVDMKS